MAKCFASTMDRSDNPSFSPIACATLRRFAGMSSLSSLSDELLLSDSVTEALSSSSKCLLGCLPPMEDLCAEGGVADDSCVAGIFSTDCPRRLGSINGEKLEGAELRGAGVGVFLVGCPGVNGIRGELLRVLWIVGRSGEELGSSASQD